MDFDFSTETITPDQTTLLTIGGVGGLELPLGTTAQRPVSGLANGAMRYNTDLNVIEGFVNTTWTPMSTGATTITLTGDVTGSGTNSIATTLATVNANVGQFTAITVNAKGLATAATNLAATGDATGTASGASIALTLATVNASPQTDTFRKITVNGKGLTTATSAVVAADITTALGYTPINKAGDTVGGTLTFTAGTVTGLPSPTAGSDAANKNYVDSAVAGLSWKQAVRAATTVNGTLATAYANGQTIDGVTLATNDRILIKNQTTQTENGIYVVQAAGAPVRSTDADTGVELVGATVFVDSGTTQSDTGWTQTANAPITIGTTNITWVQFSGSGSYTAGTGLTLTGNQFSLTSPVAATLGGTGQTSYAVGDLLFANTTTTLAKLADVATGNVLISGGVSTAPSWGKVGLTTHVSGILPIANGGTNLSALGTANQILGVNAGATGLEYKTVTAGTAISVVQGVGTVTINNTGVVSLAGTTNQISVSAATGAVTVSLPSAVTTGSLTLTGLTANSFVYSGTGSLLTSTAAPTNGQLLIGSTGAAPVAAAISAGTGISVVNGAGSITIASINNGTVTSVGFADASTLSIYNITNSPVTGAGTLTITAKTQTANTVFAGPTTGGATQPTFRALVQADLSGAIQLYRENPSTPTTPLVVGTNAVSIGSGSSAPATGAIAIGTGSLSNWFGGRAESNGSFTANGDAQEVRAQLRAITTTNAATELFLDGAGASQRLVLANNTAWTFMIKVVCRRTDTTGSLGSWLFSGLIYKDTTVGSTTVAGIAKTTIARVGSIAGANDPVLSADTTNGSLKITVTGVTGQTYRWVASIEMTQVAN